MWRAARLADAGDECPVLPVKGVWQGNDSAPIWCLPQEDGSIAVAHTFPRVPCHNPRCDEVFHRSLSPPLMFQSSPTTRGRWCKCSFLPHLRSAHGDDEEEQPTR